MNNCMHCKYAVKDSDTAVGTYQCRRFPPQIFVVPRNDVDMGLTGDTDSDWPWVRPSNWCGEFKQKLPSR